MDILRNIILFITFIIAILIPVSQWQKQGFDLNFYAEVSGMLIGALFTYFIVDYINNTKLRSQWKFYEVEIKTDLYYYFVQSVTGILFRQEYEGLLYKNYPQDLINEAFDNKILDNHNDFVPKTKRLLTKLTDYYNLPEEIQINAKAAIIYNKERIESFEKLCEKLFSLLYLMPWLRDTYQDFTNLKKTINHLKSSYEIYTNYLLKNNLNALIKAKKEYIFCLLCFIRELINFNETQSLDNAIKKKTVNQQKLAKNFYKWY